MAAAAFSSTTLLNKTPCLSSFSQSCKLLIRRKTTPHFHYTAIRASAAASEEPQQSSTATNSQPSKAPPKKPVYSMKKGQIVRVDKEKYLNSLHYLSVGHPPYFKGLDYIYEDRGEVLDLRIFETGEHALISWVGVPTAPAWLPTDMLIKADKLDYERL